MSRITFGVDILCRGCGKVHREGSKPCLVALGTVEWRTRARAWVAALAPGTKFHAEDLTAAVGRPYDANATGPMLAALSADGLVVSVGNDNSKRPARKAGRSLVWRRK